MTTEQKTPKGTPPFEGYRGHSPSKDRLTGRRGDLYSTYRLPGRDSGWTTHGGTWTIDREDDGTWTLYRHSTDGTMTRMGTFPTSDSGLHFGLKTDRGPKGKTSTYHYRGTDPRTSDLDSEGTGTILRPTS